MRTLYLATTAISIFLVGRAAPPIDGSKANVGTRSSSAMPAPHKHAVDQDSLVQANDAAVDPAASVAQRPTKSGGPVGDKTGREDHEQEERASVVNFILSSLEPVLMAKDRVATRIRHSGIGSKYKRLGLHKGDAEPGDIINWLLANREFIHPDDEINFHKQAVKVLADHHSLTDVVKKLESIRLLDTKGGGVMLQRSLASHCKDRPNELADAWLASDLEPGNLHELLGLGNFMALRDYPDSGIAWFKYNELLRTNGKNDAMSVEETAKLLFRYKSQNEVDAFIEKVKTRKGGKSLPKRCVMLK